MHVQFFKAKKRKTVAAPKFYYFDLGVKNILTEINSLPPKTDLYGQAFENFIALEIRAYLSYYKKDLPLSFWKTRNGNEVDFLIGDKLAIEVKISENINEKHLKGLKLLQDENCVKIFALFVLTIQFAN